MTDPQAIRTQVEYYLSDKNLATDEFFRNKISANPDGWLDMAFIMSCRKLKALTSDPEAVVSALTDSDQVEVKGEPGTRLLRRKDNKALPPLNAGAIEQMKERKRQAKAEDKKAEQPTGELTERHFKEQKVFIFTHEGAEGKADWRALEDELKLQHPSIRILYSRSDEEKTGHLVLCSIGLSDEFEQHLLANKLTKDD